MVDQSCSHYDQDVKKRKGLGSYNLLQDKHPMTGKFPPSGTLWKMILPPSRALGWRCMNLWMTSKSEIPFTVLVMMVRLPHQLIFFLLSDNFIFPHECVVKETISYWLGCLPPYRLLGKPGIHSIVQTSSCFYGMDIVFS